MADEDNIADALVVPCLIIVADAGRGIGAAITRAGVTFEGGGKAPENGPGGIVAMTVLDG